MTNQAAMPPANPTRKTQCKQCWIAHVDLDAFFASCEQRDQPAYRGKPVVVGALPGNRGVVAAASYEARKFGIRSAMPISEAWRRCPEAIYLRPDMKKYSAASKRVFAALTEITPAIEKASVDEAYLDISGLEKLHGAPEQIGQKIRECIFAATGLKASVGIGPNRLIAKLGSDYCKPDGLVVISPDEVVDFLTPMPISNLRGAGKQTQKKFSRLGITTIGQLRLAEPAVLRENLGRHAADNFLRQAHGIASTTVHARKQRKSISKERTFAEDHTSLEPLREQMNALAGAVAHTARQEKLAGRIVKLKIRFSGFETFTRQLTLEQPSNDPRTLFESAWSLFSKGDLPAKPVRLIGIGLSGWPNDRIGSAEEHSQGDLFQADATSRNELLTTMDEITRRYGPDSLNLGIRPRKQSRD